MKTQPSVALVTRRHSRSLACIASIALAASLLGGCSDEAATGGSTTAASAEATNEDELRAFYTDYIAALNAHDFDSMDKFVSDEIRFGEQTLTREEIITILKGIADAVPDFEWEVTQIIVDGDRLGVSLVDKGTPTKEWLGVAPTGESFSIPEMAMYRVEDGRFTEMFNVWNAAEVEVQLND